MELKVVSYRVRVLESQRHTCKMQKSVHFSFHVIIKHVGMGKLDISFSMQYIRDINLVKI